MDVIHDVLLGAHLDTDPRPAFPVEHHQLDEIDREGGEFRDCINRGIVGPVGPFGAAADRWRGGAFTSHARLFVVQRAAPCYCEGVSLWGCVEPSGFSVRGTGGFLLVRQRIRTNVLRQYPFGRILQPMATTVTPIRVTLREAREAAGLTQVELAERVGVRQATISDIETGKSSRIDLPVLDRLCDALGVEPGDLLEREKPTKRRKR
jgi:putative transcriptional regulator